MALSPSTQMQNLIHPALERAKEWIAAPKQLLINGSWVEAVSGQRFDTLNPATEALLTTVAAADAHDVELAVQAARAALEAPTWFGISPHERAAYLLKIAEKVEAHADELAAIETLDNGVPFAASRSRIPHIAETFRYYAGWVSKIYGTTNPSDSTRLIYMLREPMGVCALINAWNVPLGMAATKLAPALACGNTAILKPAEQAPLSTLRLAELIQEVGLPAGVLNVLPGLGVHAGAAMAAHPDIDKIAFTGSTVVGKQILQASAGNLKKVSLELGGKSPNIIFEDADIDAAVLAAVGSFCRNSGQICSSGTRLLVQESIYARVAEKVCELASRYTVGDPMANHTQLGPLISALQLSRVMGHIESAQKEGAHMALGGKRVGSEGYFVEPTVFTQVENRMRIAQEEIFGPVLCLIQFRDEADALRIANDTIYGLAAAVWTKDGAKAQRMARGIKAGRVWLNTYGEADPAMSIGGYKQSGWGREYGAESIEAYTQTKSVLLKL